MTVPSPRNEADYEWVGALNKALNEQNAVLVAENELLRAALEQIMAIRLDEDMSVEGALMVARIEMRQVAHAALAARDGDAT